MNPHRWCKYCEDYVPGKSFPDHKRQHEIGMNSDAVNRKQYTGTSKRIVDDYMICVLHQKKITNGKCPIKNCVFVPFGMIKKSYMIRCMKGIVDATDIVKTKPFFPHIDINTGKQLMIPIDMTTRTIKIMGVTIFIRA